MDYRKLLHFAFGIYLCWWKGQNQQSLLSLAYVLLQDIANPTNTIHIKEEQCLFADLGLLSTLVLSVSGKGLALNVLFGIYDFSNSTIYLFHNSPVDKVPWKWKYGFLSLFSVQRFNPLTSQDYFLLTAYKIEYFRRAPEAALSASVWKAILSFTAHLQLPKKSLLVYTSVSYTICGQNTAKVHLTSES